MNVGISSSCSRPSVLPTDSSRPSARLHLIMRLANVVISRITPATVRANAPQEDYGLRYLDPFGLEKTYVEGKSRLVKAADTPFDAERLSHLIGTGNPLKIRVTETTSAVEVPMQDVNGEVYRVRSHFVHYRGPKGQATIMPNGEVDLSEAQHMRRNMLPGMARKAGEFAMFEIPPEQMLQRTRGTFSCFYPLGASLHPRA